jgi:membrane protein implicated in regulation of membrane protease activity
MAMVYVAALLIALGLLVLQIVMGGKDVGDHAAHGGKDLGDAEGGVVGIFLSTRFWIFAALGFGLSGSLLHAFSLAGPIGTAALAGLSGVVAGLFAVLAFRAVARASTGTVSAASSAVGKSGKVLVALGRGKRGQVRVEIGGTSVDLLATTDAEAIARGDYVLVEDVSDGVAQVSRRPPELGEPEP